MFLNKKNPYLLYIGIFLLFIPLTYLYPRLNSDDYGYAFNWSNENEYLETPGDFIESNIAHYMNRNGRIWANGIAAIFSANDFDIIFKILNAVFFVLLIFFTIRVAEKNERITNVKIICLFLLTWFLTPVPGQTWLWMCGALNYLWAAVFTMGFLYMLRQSIYRKIKLPVLAFIASIICGWQNEAFAAPIWGACVLYYFIKRPALPKQTLWLWIGYSIGAMFMIFAPGTIHRAGNSIFSTDTIGLAILFRIYALGIPFLALKLKATIIAIVALVLMRIRNKHTFKEFVNNNLLLLLIIGCGIAFISVICYVEERGLMGIEIFSIILLYRIIFFISPILNEKFRNWNRYILAGLCAIFIYDYYLAFKAIYNIHEADKKIMSEYLVSEDGIVCSPLEQKDYDNRFILYCNEVTFQEGITKYYNYHTGVWKPFYLLPEPFYKAIKGDNSLFSEQYKLKGSNTFYEYKDERYYIAKYNSKEGRKRVERIYKFKEDGVIKTYLPMIAHIIERFYHRTNLNVTRLEVNDTCYIFVNKIKRMLPELQLTKLDFKEKPIRNKNN